MPFPWLGRNSNSDLLVEASPNSKKEKLEAEGRCFRHALPNSLKSKRSTQAPSEKSLIVPLSTRWGSGWWGALLKLSCRRLAQSNRSTSRATTSERRRSHTWCKCRRWLSPTACSSLAIKVYTASMRTWKWTSTNSWTRYSSKSKERNRKKLESWKKGQQETKLAVRSSKQGQLHYSEKKGGDRKSNKLNLKLKEKETRSQIKKQTNEKRKELTWYY